MDENDKIIKLTEHLATAKSAAGWEFNFDFAESDYANEFIPGTTAELLEVAAEHASLDIVQKGANSARLRKRQGRIVRA